ncbi:MAG: hypothetical protein ACI837_003079, partial [Crocinitomicaceae bacterium]
TLMHLSLSAQTYHLSTRLSEISGIDLINDSTLVAHNDGGHEPILYLLNLSGEIQKHVTISNAANLDWEDLTVDKTHIYIGDIGNNLNNRKNIIIYKVSIADVLTKEEVTAEYIKISYSEQIAFPPKKAGLRFDAEALAVYKDNLYIFTKNRMSPTDGMTWVYQVSTKPGTYTLTHETEIFIGKGGFWKDAITAADVKGDEFFLMTYNRILIKEQNADGEFTGDRSVKFKSFSQKEAIVVKSNLEIFVADEKQVLLGGPRLYKLNPLELESSTE